jgi:hypothetical protein
MMTMEVGLVILLADVPIKQQPHNHRGRPALASCGAPTSNIDVTTRAGRSSTFSRHIVPE